MIDKETCKKFIGKYVQIQQTFGNQPFFSNGIVQDVNDVVLIMEFKRRLQVYDLKRIDAIREAE